MSDLSEENRRQAILLKKVSDRESELLGIVLDGEALLKSNIKYLKRVLEIIEIKRKS